MKDAFWEQKGIAYRVNTFSDTRKTLVFIHGLAASCSAWAHYETALENDFNLLAYDLRGHGWSHKFKNYDDYDVKHFADDLEALLAYLDIQACSLIAASFGTIIAVAHQHFYPGRTKEILFVSPLYKQHRPIENPARRVLNSLVRLVSLVPFSSRPRKRLDYSQFDYPVDFQPWRYLIEIRTLPLSVYLFCLSRSWEFSEDQWWSKIQVPATIVHGTNDTFAPYPRAVELSKANPAAKFVSLEGGNHYINMTHAEEIVSQIQRLNDRFTPVSAAQ